MPSPAAASPSPPLAGARPAPAPAPAGEAAPRADLKSGYDPSKPTEWLRDQLTPGWDDRPLPAPTADEAQGVIDAERKAAQQAGGSVTGKPYVPTLDEALDNPIKQPPPR